MKEHEKSLRTLVGFCITCRRTNRDEWMRLFCKHLNACGKVLNWTEEIVYDGDTFQLDQDETYFAAPLHPTDQP